MKKLGLALIIFLILLAGASAQNDGNAPAKNSDIVSLREYIDLRFEVTQRAIDKAEATMNERLAGMNEFRNTLKDQSATFVTRGELWGSLSAIAFLILGVMNYLLNKARKNGERAALKDR